MKPRDLLVAAAVVLVVSGVFTLPAFDRLGGLSIDLLFWLRHQTVGPRHPPATSPTVVVAIDEETYRTDPFRSLPKVLWTKHLAAVVDATLTAGATVVGFDVIYPTSVELYIKGFDRDLLLTLKHWSRTDQVVLGKVQHQYKPIAPFPGYSYAVGHGKNIRSVNLYSDDDGVRPPHSAHLPKPRRRRGNLDDPGARRQGARDGRPAHRRRRHGPGGRRHSRVEDQSDHHQLRQRAGGDSDLFAGRSPCLREERRHRLFPAPLRRQGRAGRRGPRRRGPQADLATPRPPRRRGRACPPAASIR